MQRSRTIFSVRNSLLAIVGLLTPVIIYYTVGLGLNATYKRDNAVDAMTSTLGGDLLLDAAAKLAAEREAVDKIMGNSILSAGAGATAPRGRGRTRRWSSPPGRAPPPRPGSAARSAN